MPIDEKASPAPRSTEGQSSSPAPSSTPAQNTAPAKPEPTVADLIKSFEEYKSGEDTRQKKAVTAALKQARMTASDTRFTDRFLELPEEKQAVLLDRVQVEKENVMNLIEKHGLDDDEDYETLLALPRNRRESVARKLASNKASGDDLEKTLKQAGGAAAEKLAPGGGGVARQDMTWDQAQRIKSVNEISDADYEKLVRSK